MEFGFGGRRAGGRGGGGEEIGGAGEEGEGVGGGVVWGEHCLGCGMGGTGWTKTRRRTWYRTGV